MQLKNYLKSNTNLIQPLTLSLITLKRLNLHYLAPIFIILNYDKVLKIKHLFYYLAPILLINLCHISLNFSTQSLLRMLQLCVATLTLNIISHILNKKFLVTFIKMTLLLSILYITFDFFQDNFIQTSKKVFGLKLSKRYLGIIGEPNFSALLTGVLALISFEIRKHLLSFLLIITYLPTSSRTILAMVITYIFLKLIYHLSKNSLKYLPIPFILFIFLSPLTFPMISEQLNREQKLKLNQVSSERFHLQTAYAKMFFDKPFGTGYMQGRKHLKPKEEKYGFYKDLDQHNIYLQILTEFGFFGFIFYALFIYRTFQIIPNDAYPFAISFFTCFYFINGLNEVIFWISIGFILNYNNI